MGRGTVVHRRGCPLVLLVNLVLQVWVSAASSLHDLAKSAVITFDPPMIHDLVEGHNRTVSVSMSIPQETFASMTSDETYRLSVGSFHPDIAASPSHSAVAKSSFVYNNESNFYTVDTDVIIHGNSLGKTGLRMRLVRAENWDDVDESWKVPEKLDDNQKNLLDVWVKRSLDSERWTHIFVASVVILITVANILMGCELDMNVVYSTVKRPIAPAIGFATQFVVMPLLAYGIAKTVLVSRGLFSLALGLFITGCSPGGGASNFWTLLLDGNVNLSVTMTFISTLASLVMMPLWISLLGKDFLQGFSTDFKIQIPYAKITRSLVALVVPLLIGIAIKKWKPEWAAKARKVMRPFIIFVLIFVVVFGAITNLYMFKMMTVPALLGGLLLPWCGFMFGCFVSIITRRTPPDVTAIAIETGIQNTGIAILVLKASFTQPDADIGAVIPVIAACFTPGPLLLGAAVHLVLKRLKKRTESLKEVLAGEDQKPDELSSMSLLQQPDVEPEKPADPAAIATIA
uniref:Bile acid:sodium symporter domain containing protein n=1 Tax=Haemonchus contortus TaxID=6289 RepID=A0A7I4YEC2_HAECO|nr:Bile acid:sodium symporter domain containing protein [Haemonchus contortus]